MLAEESKRGEATTASKITTNMNEADKRLIFVGPTLSEFRMGDNLTATWHLAYPHRVSN